MPPEVLHCVWEAQHATAPGGVFYLAARARGGAPVAYHVSHPLAGGAGIHVGGKSCVFSGGICK
ncbi:hypothetical protein SBA3_1350010 [Candidatus Sulfopaludibacter sp. SbA3]|nr:hypothetical protein SBA3_1350010 [Candidatus Sulfopaludibacter sp. SbA3]